MKIRILTENTVYQRGLLAEHGLSLLIEANGKKLLFDTGQTDVYIKNAKKLKEELTGLDGIILSHGHYDHCGGVEYFPAEDYVNMGKKLPPLYVREGAFSDKRHRKQDVDVKIGIDWEKEKYPGDIIETKERWELGNGFTLLGKIGYETEFEPYPAGFFIFKEGRDELDLMEDEQILVVETERGLCLFMGCSHMGIINCIRRVKKEFPEKRIHGILAGMHLKNAPKSRVDKTIAELKKLDFDYLIPVHCTGMEAIVRMKQELGERCLLAEAGKEFLLAK